jgi:hypothetical protein
MRSSGTGCVVSWVGIGFVEENGEGGSLTFAPDTLP